MTRDITTTKYQDRHVEFEFLYEITYSGGTIYLTSGSEDVSVGGNIYRALGFVLHDMVDESADFRAQGIQLNLPAVDTTILTSLLSEHFRGRNVIIYVVFRDKETGELETPHLIWRGRQLSDYTIRQSVDRDDSSGGRATIRTRVSSIMAAIKIVRSVRANRDSHQRMLERAGLTPNDLFFSRIPTIMGRELYWGIDTPDPSVWSPGTGAGAGDDSLEGER